MYLLGGEKYEGEFDRNKFKGRGTLFFNNGDNYTGSFKQDRAFGKGILHEKGNKYVGDFVSGLRNGQGMMKYADGTQF